MLAFLRSIFTSFTALAQSQTLPGAMSLPTRARIGLGVFSAFGNPTLGSLKVAQPRMSVRGVIEKLEARGNRRLKALSFPLPSSLARKQQTTSVT